MKAKLNILILMLILFGSCSANKAEPNDIEQAANKVLIRTIGAENAAIFQLSYQPGESTDSYSIKVENNKVYISGSSATFRYLSFYHVANTVQYCITNANMY